MISSPFSFHLPDWCCYAGISYKCLMAEFDLYSSLCWSLNTLRSAFSTKGTSRYWILACTKQTFIPLKEFNAKTYFLRNTSKVIWKEHIWKCFFLFSFSFCSSSFTSLEAWLEKSLFPVGSYSPACAFCV